jgi:DNA invertase Pin-like site-specific DNA recombinase
MPEQRQFAEVLGDLLAEQWLTAQVVGRAVPAPADPNDSPRQQKSSDRNSPREYRNSPRLTTSRPAAPNTWEDSFMRKIAFNSRLGHVAGPVIGSRRRRPVLEASLGIGTFPLAVVERIGWFVVTLLFLALFVPTACDATQSPPTTTSAVVVSPSFIAHAAPAPEKAPFPSPKNSGLPIRDRLHTTHHRKRPRSKAEFEKERRERLERTNREINEVHEAYLARFGPNQSRVNGAIYARFSTRFQDSIADQVRSILEYALAQRIFVPRELIFFDMAVRGFKSRRSGLEQFKTCVRKKKATVALFFSTSRLFRKQYRTLEFVDQIHKGLGVRCVFVKSGVDTNDKQRWETMLSIQAMIDQFVVTMNIANIQAAHEGLLHKQLVFGTVSFGYTGNEIEGPLTKQGRPRRRIAIDHETAPTVLQVFRWYVDEELSINEIVQRLNSDPNIPLYQGATSGQWTRQSVARLLRNTRYRGLWKYGVVESVYNPVGDYNRQKTRSVPLREVQLEELRIVLDELWYAAQARLANRSINAGRPPLDGERHTRPKALNDIYACSKHGRLHVSGSYGMKMHCPICNRLPAAERELFSDLNRELALELICRKIAGLIQGDKQLVQDAMAACALEVEAAQRPDPTRLAPLKSQADQLQRTINLTRRTAGDSEKDQDDAAQQINELQRDRAKVLAQVAELEAASARTPKMPTEREAKKLVQELGDIFTEAAQTEETIDEANLRKIIDLLTGGSIDLFQMGERRRQGGWLEARFEVRLLPYLAEKLTGAPPAFMTDAIPVVIDLRRPAPIEERSDRAWKLAYEDRLLNVEIAAALNCSTNHVTRLLKHAAAKRGVPHQSGFARRAAHPRKQRPPLKYQEIADDVVRKRYAGEPVKEIVKAAGVSWDTFHAAVVWWHESRGLAVPDARLLRKLTPCEPPTGAPLPPKPPQEETE